MNEIAPNVFGPAGAVVIFSLGAFLSLFGAALAERMYRAQSLPLFCAVAATLAVAGFVFVVRLAGLVVDTGYVTEVVRDPQLTLVVFALLSVFWLIVVVTPSQVVEPCRAMVMHRRWLVGVLVAGVMVLGPGSIKALLGVQLELGEAARAITLGTICGLFFVATVVGGVRCWRTRNAIWVWLALASFACTIGSVIFYGAPRLANAGLAVYAILAAAALLVVLGLFADYARFVKTESELRRGLLDNSLRLESETRHQATILALAREAVVHFDRDERILHVTPSFCTLLQTQVDKCLNHQLAEVLPPAWTEELAPALQEARRGRTFQADLRLVHNREKKPFAVYAKPLRDDKERISGIHLALFDLGEQILLETQMQAASADLNMFRRVVELATEAIYLTDAQYRIVYANEATERLTGITRAELLGQQPRRFRAPAVVQEVEGEIARKLAQGIRYQGEIESRRKDGSSFVSNVTVAPLPAAGAAARHLWIEFDTTERRRLENAVQERAAQVAAGVAALADSRRYHESLLDAMRDLVLVVNRKGQCTFMNAAARERLGCAPENLEIKKLPAFVADLLRLDKNYGESVKIEVRDHEAPVRTQSGELLSCIWQARPLFDTAGDCTGVIAIGRDVADLKQMQSTLVDYQHQLEEKVRARTAELERRVDHLRQLMEIGERIRLHADLDEILRRIADSIAALGWQCVLVFIRDAQQLRLAGSSGFLRRQRAALKSVHQLSYDAVAMFFDERFRQGRCYFIDSTRLASETALPFMPAGLCLASGKKKSGLPAASHQENEWQERDSVLVPISVKDEIAGLLAVFSPRDGRRPEPQQLLDLEIIADDAAIAIANSRLLRSHRRSEHYARVLADISETFRSTGTVEQIVSDMAKITAHAFGCAACLAFHEEADRWFAATEPASGKSTQRGALHFMDRNLSAFAEGLRGKKPAVLRSSRAGLPLPGLALPGRRNGASAGTGEIDVLVAPLYTRGQKRGFLAHFDLQGKKTFDAADLEFARDLAERVALVYENAQLFFETEKKARELERANEMVSDFLASTSHELRTPMQAILSMSDFLMRGLPGKLNEEQKRQISIIQNSGRSLLTLINDILDLSKIEAGKMGVAAEHFDAAALVRETAETVAPLCREKNLRLHVDTDKDLPDRLTSDPALLRRVLLNILSNAVKFTPAGRGEIHVSASLCKERHLTISVRDTGIGIAPEHWRKIFEPFQQVEPTITRRHGGTGLGLAISRKIVSLLGGTIAVDSALGKGSTFTFQVPVRVEPAAGPIARPPEKAVAAKKTARKSLLQRTKMSARGKPRILVVEDDENTRYAMQFLLENEGYEVDFANGGEQALVAAQHRKPQLILLDIMMPTMNGYQVSRMLKAQRQLAHIPVVALTARAMKEDRKMALAAGCDDHLAKPFERKDILDTLEKWLGKSAAKG